MWRGDRHLLVAWTVARVLSSHRKEARLRRPALALILLLTLQICLGAITIWTRRAVFPTTAHVAIGAAVLVTSLTITIRAWRLYRHPRRADGDAHRVAIPKSWPAPRHRMNARPAIIETRLDAARTRAAEYLELTKPRVTAMVLMTTLAGYYLGAARAFESIVALNLLIGTALASGGTLALNQYIERDTDAVMDRTRSSPDSRTTHRGQRCVLVWHRRDRRGSGISAAHRELVIRGS